MRSVANQDQSRLVLLCDAVIDAVPLAAICVLPILLNPQSVHGAYQPIKFGFLRLVAIIGLAAWLVRTIELRSLALDPQSRAAAFWRSPIAISLGVFGLMVGVSTAFSVHSTVSLWGAYETFLGAFTYAAELILFALIATNFRKREQIERLITLSLVTSLAVSVFAILQRFGWDPRFPKLEGGRAFATAGHPIYLAGYLLMSIPLTIYRLLTLRQKGQRAAASLRRTAKSVYAIVLATQLAAFFCAESRGPVLALALALIAFAVLYAASHQWGRGLAIFGVALLSIFAAIAIAAATSNLKNIPVLRRFAETQSLERGVEVFRADIWKQAPQIIFAKAPVTHPTDGQIDRWRALRPWIGYGSETLDSVLPFYYQVDVAQSTIENRFHDSVWDLWFAIGAVGLSAFLTAILFLFSACYRGLGLVRSTTSSVAFWTCSIAFAAGGAFFFTRYIGIGFAGVGLIGGVVAGLLVFAAGSIFWREAGSILPQLSADRILIITLLAAIVGHLIDTSFAFVTASTAVLFWTYAGLLVTLLRRIKDPQLREDSIVESSARGRISLMPAALVSIGIVSFLIATIHHLSFQPFSIIDVVVRSLCDIEGTEEQHSFLLLPIFVFWISASFAFVLDDALGHARRKIAASFFRILLISGAVGIAFLFVQSIQIVRIGPLPPMWGSESIALHQTISYERLFLVGTASLLVLLAATAWFSRNASSDSLGSLRGTIAGALGVVASVSGIWIAAITPLRAGVCAGWGETLDGVERQQLSAEVYRRAIELDPRPFVYRALRSEACLKTAMKLSEPARREAYFTQTESALLDARKETDLSRASFLLARLYLLWAENEDEPKKSVLNRKALAASREALTFEPHTPAVATLHDFAETQAASQ